MAKKNKTIQNKKKKTEAHVCLCTYVSLENGVSLPSWWRARPGLLSAIGESNDSFDPIRISAKSTLCSLRAAHAS